MYTYSFIRKNNLDMLKLGLDKEIQDSLIIHCLMEEMEKGDKLPFPKIDFYALRGSTITDYLASIQLPSPIFLLTPDYKTKEGEVLTLKSAPVTQSKVLVSGKAGYFELLNRDKKIIYRGLVSNKKLEDSPYIYVNDIDWREGDILNLPSISLTIR